MLKSHLSRFFAIVMSYSRNTVLTPTLGGHDISSLHSAYSLGTHREYILITMIAILSATPTGRFDADPEKFSARKDRGLLSSRSAIKLMHSEVDSMNSIRAGARLLVGRVIAPTMTAK